MDHSEADRETAWRLETADTDEAENRIIIQPAQQTDPHTGLRYFTISVAPWRGQQAPTLPVLPVGTIYQDRTGVRYTVIQAVCVETGDEESSIWVYEYLAVLGEHAPTWAWS